MYMNCAHVEIVNGGTGLPPDTPDMFIGEINQCKSQEFSNLYFPDPGRAVQFGGPTAWVNAGPVGQCNFPPDVPERATFLPPPSLARRVREKVRRGLQIL